MEWYRLLFKRYYRPPSLVIVSLDWFSAGANRGDPQHEEIALAQDSRYLPWNVLFKLFWEADDRGKITLVMNMVRIMQAGPDVRYFFFHRDDSAMRGYDHGYTPLDGAIDLASGGERDFSVNEAFLNDLTDLLDEIKAQGSQIVLVQMPIYKPETILNINKSRIFDDIAHARGIPYLDYNGTYASSLNSQASMFGDWSHLHRQGSKIFTAKLSDDLHELIANKVSGICQH